MYDTRFSYRKVATPKVAIEKAAKLESNEGRCFRNFTVFFLTPFPVLNSLCYDYSGSFLDLRAPLSLPSRCHFLICRFFNRN